MLAGLTRILRDQGFVGRAAEPAYNVTLISDKQLTLQAVTRDGSRFLARVKRRGVAPDEFDSCRAAWRTFPAYAPEPLGQYFAGEWEFIVLRGIAHDNLLTGDIGRNRQRLVDKLSAYFDASSQARHALGGSATHRDFLQGVRDRTTDANAAAILDQWMLNRALDELPHIPQHGDFTINNVALRKDRLVIFDWEDFGKVCLPGLDLCTAIASDTGFDAARLQIAIGLAGRSPTPYVRLLKQCCPCVGITRERFAQMVPLYLAVFLDLKREYAASIRIALSQLIAEVRGGAT